MSSSTGKKIEWLVIMPDQKGALDRRMAVRPKHLENITPDAEAGFWLFGGAFTDAVPEDGKTPPIIGSAMLAYAESKEEVLEKLKNDVYTKEEVWDWDRVQIWPFRSAIRTGLHGGK